MTFKPRPPNYQEWKPGDSKAQMREYAERMRDGTAWSPHTPVGRMARDARFNLNNQFQPKKRVVRKGRTTAPDDSLTEHQKTYLREDKKFGEFREQLDETDAISRAARKKLREKNKMISRKSG